MADRIIDTRCNIRKEARSPDRRVYGRSYTDGLVYPKTDTQNKQLTGFGFIDSLYPLFALPDNRVELSPALVQGTHNLAPPAVEIENLVLQLLDPALLYLMCACDLHGSCELGVHGKQLADGRGWGWS